jgi:hypothetical protein
MPDPTLSWLSSALRRYVASQPLLPIQNSEEPQFLTVSTHCLFGKSVSRLSSLSSRRTCPAEICFRPLRLSKPSGQNYSTVRPTRRHSLPGPDMS